jgi:NifU-like protein involved in Fe-S cluster formation
MDLALHDLYDRRIRDLAASVDSIRPLAAPDASATAQSRLCGSRVTADICLRDGVIAAYGHRVRACLIGRASAALLGRLIVGLSPAELRAGTQAMRALLADRVVPPREPWRAFEIFLPVADFPSRHGAALLPFEAVEQALASLGLRPDAIPTAETRLSP